MLQACSAIYHQEKSVLPLDFIFFNFSDSKENILKCVVPSQSDKIMV